MGIFDNAGKGNFNSGGNYFTPGRYLVKIEKATHGTSQNGKGDYVAIEGTVMSVELERKVTATGKDTSSNILGDRASTVCFSSSHAFTGTCDNFVAAVRGVDMKDVTVEMTEEVFLKGGAVGVELDLDAVSIKTRAGKDFTKLVWSSADEF